MHLRQYASFIFSVAIAASTSSARADLQSSQAWFSSLGDQTRSAIQADLVLLGEYDGIVDGRFGASTFRALQAHQNAGQESPTGVLSSAELDELQAQASIVSQELGLEDVQDPNAGLVISVPTKLLTQRSASAGGTDYRSPAGDFDLQTTRLTDQAGSFAALFRARGASSALRSVTYSAIGASSFSVTGMSGSQYFYDRFYQHGDDVVGYTLTWSRDSGDKGAVLATHLASFSHPLEAAAAAQAPETSLPVPLNAVASTPQTAPAPQDTEVPLQASGGTFLVPVLINGALTLDFTLDSGAADVSIPADVVLTLIRTGTITANDFTGTQTYTLADGSTVPSQTFRIRSLKVGDKVIENVAGSVASVNGSLLLGQSFLTHFASWSIDNNRHALILRDAQASASNGEASPPPGGGASQLGLPRSNAAGSVPAMVSPAFASAPPPLPTPDNTGNRLALYGGLDFFGNDISRGRTRDAVECATDCLNEEQCRAFTFNANPSIHSGPNCFLKGDVNHIEAYSTAIGGLFLQPNETAPQYSFDAIDPTTDLLNNREFVGGDLSNYPYTPARTLDGCRMACIDNSSCQAFSFVASLRQCWLKGSTGLSRSARGIVTVNGVTCR